MKDEKLNTGLQRYFGTLSNLHCRIRNNSPSTGTPCQMPARRRVPGCNK
jgi:hypothetical protein